MNRKSFIKNSAIAALSLSINPTKNIFDKGNEDTKVKLAIIGVGARGKSHLKLLLGRSDVVIVAICDVDARVINEANEIVLKSGKNKPNVYTGDDYAWQVMLKKESLDGVIIVTCRERKDYGWMLTTVFIFRVNQKRMMHGRTKNHGLRNTIIPYGQDGAKSLKALDMAEWIFLLFTHLLNL
ncbi:MAG TPA: hypothetical protein VFT78_00425 [Hanamia sp.]|nr:hypothetical protein [Hanamia sp.]